MSYPPPPGPQDWKGEPDPAYGQGQQVPQGQPPYSGYQTPGYGAPDPYGQAPKTSGKATTSLVLGVASIVLLCIGFLLGIPAIVLGVRARKEIRGSQGRLTGDGLALGGIITGIIGTLLGLAVVALIISTIAIGSSVDEVVDRTCEQLAQDEDPSNDCT